MSTRILVTDFGVSGGLDDECADEVGTAYGTMSPYTQTAATGGHVPSDVSGCIALATNDRTLPGVSAPSRVVRSIS